MTVISGRAGMTIIVAFAGCDPNALKP